MVATIKHIKHVYKADGPDASRLQPSDWNATHVIENYTDLIGPKGDPGADSTVPGPKGDTGEQGIQGIPGVKGDTGEAGAKGDTGAQGEPGVKGDAGVGVPTGGTAGQVLSKIDAEDYNTQWATAASGGGVTEIPWHADGSANFTLTNSPLAERFALNQPTRMIKFVPLSGKSQVRLVGVQVTTSASANTPKVRAVYKTGAYSSTLGSFSDIGTSEVSLSLTGTGAKDTGWVDLAEAAKADVWVGLTEKGGDGAIDPAFGHLQMYFK